MTVSFELELPPNKVKIARADLTFYGLDHSGPSYEVRVYFREPEANVSAPPQDNEYIGSFSVFAHGGCFGEHGHCQVQGPVTTFDRRLPHQLVPATRVLICTEDIQRIIGRGLSKVTVTVVPIVRPSPLVHANNTADVLKFDQVALHTYE